METHWPLSFDQNSQSLSSLFHIEFPIDDRLNWWISQTCFGEFTRPDIEVRISYGSYEELDQLRLLLVHYYQ